MREKVEKSWNIAFFHVFPIFCGSGGSKNRFPKAGCGAMRRWEMKKLYAVVAWSWFGSQNRQNTSLSDRFWKLRCRKRACRCGAKHISKTKLSWKKTPQYLAIFQVMLDLFFAVLPHLLLAFNYFEDIPFRWGTISLLSNIRL